MKSHKIKHASLPPGILLLLIALVAMPLFVRVSPGGRDEVPALRGTIEGSQDQSITFSDPFFDLLDYNDVRSFVESIKDDVIEGTEISYDGMPVLENASPPSLLATRDIVAALLTLDGMVSFSQEIINWILSCYDASTGSFIDAYSADYFTAVDGGYQKPFSLYSQVVSTGSAVATLLALGYQFNATAASTISAYLSSCYIPAAGGYGGNPSETVATVLDTYHAVKALAALGQASLVDIGAVTSFLLGLQDGTGLFFQSNPGLISGVIEWSFSSTTITRQAVELLALFGNIEDIDVGSLCATILSLFSNRTNLFGVNAWFPNGTLATIDAMLTMLVVGYPAGFNASTVLATLESVGNLQQAAGGWAPVIDDTYPNPWHSARILSGMVNILGSLPAVIDGIASRDFLLESMLMNGAGSKAAFGFLSKNLPSLISIRAFSDARVIASVTPSSTEKSVMQGFLESFSVPAMPYYLPGTKNNISVPFTFVPVAGQVRTSAIGWIFGLERFVSISREYDLGFSLAELNEMEDFLNSLQVGPGESEHSGLLAYSPFAANSIGNFSGGIWFNAGLASTVVGLRAMNALLAYGSPGQFASEELIDVQLLVDRILSMYSEAEGTAWFSLPEPLSYQRLNDGLHSTMLEEIRLCLEILELCGRLDSFQVVNAVSMEKVQAMLDGEVFHSLEDIDNYVVASQLLGTEMSRDEMRGIVQNVLDFKEPGSCWFIDSQGIPSLANTVIAMDVLSKFACLTGTTTSIFDNGGTLEVHAGMVMTVNVEAISISAGPVQGFIFDIFCEKLAIFHQNVYESGISHAVVASVPLVPESLGPVILTMTGKGFLLNDIVVSATIVATLEIELEGSGNELYVTCDDPVQVGATVYMVNPSLSSDRLVVSSAMLTASGLNVNHTVQFTLLDGGNGETPRYMASLEVNPAESETRYHVEATMAYCAGASMVFTIVHQVPFAFAPYLLAPLGAFGTIIAARTFKVKGPRRVKITKEARGDSFK
ncbi:MAG: prenyltransferase/squalene oxidase repeat-containing protein [Promethearchaeota archaeon]